MPRQGHQRGRTGASGCGRLKWYCRVWEVATAFRVWEGEGDEAGSPGLEICSICATQCAHSAQMRPYAGAKDNALPMQRYRAEIQPQKMTRKISSFASASTNVQG
eukprot:358866-Chlamydomonas_euryale.AAC.11